MSDFFAEQSDKSITQWFRAASQVGKSFLPHRVGCPPWRDAADKTTDRKFDRSILDMYNVTDHFAMTFTEVGATSKSFPLANVAKSATAASYV